jgi:hypothetical protein
VRLEAVIFQNTIRDVVVKLHVRTNKKLRNRVGLRGYTHVIQLLIAAEERKACPFSM